MFHNVAGLWIQPGMFRLTDTECNALYIFFILNVSQHCWPLNAARYTKADEFFFFFLMFELLFVDERSLVAVVVNVKAALWTMNAAPPARLSVHSRSAARLLVTQEVVLVVQEEIVPALLLFGVLRGGRQRSRSTMKTFSVSVSFTWTERPNVANLFPVLYFYCENPINRL